MEAPARQGTRTLTKRTRPVRAACLMPCVHPGALERAGFHHSLGILSCQLWNNAHCGALPCQGFLPSPAVTSRKQ